MIDYENVKTPFSLYEEENSDYGYYEGKTIKDESPDENKAFNIINIILYGFMFLFAFIGILSLCFPSTRQALFSLFT